MIALIILFVFAVYLLISALVIWGAVRIARRLGIKGWKFGVPAALGMYLLVFWDHIPTILLHKYYCATEAGFWIYKTPEQWRQENPGVEKTVRDIPPLQVEQERLGQTQRFRLTPRVYEDVTRFRVSHLIGRTEKILHGAKNGDLIARSVSFFRGASGNVISLGGSLEELRQALLFGWSNRECTVRGESPTDSFDRFAYQFSKGEESK